MTGFVSSNDLLKPLSITAKYLVISLCGQCCVIFREYDVIQNAIKTKPCLSLYMGKIESTPTKKITLEVKTPLVVFSKYKHKPNVNIGFVQYINVCLVQTYHIASVQFSRTVMSNSLQPHGLQHARLSCSSPTLGACSNSHLSGR